MTDTKNEKNDPALIPQRELKTQRLLLRPFQLIDAKAMEALANDRDIAANTRAIEFPYPEGEGQVWISQHPSWWQQGKSAIFAICNLESQQLVGTIGLEIDADNHHAELGYWIGRPFWNLGYCSESGVAILKFAFDDLGLRRIYAHHLIRNPASGRVLEKIGLKKEGVLREHVRKWGVFEDIAIYGTLASDHH